MFNFCRNLFVSFSKYLFIDLFLFQLQTFLFSSYHLIMSISVRTINSRTLFIVVVARNMMLKVEIPTHKKARIVEASGMSFEEH
jgi:hypothetical protein